MPHPVSNPARAPALPCPAPPRADLTRFCHDLEAAVIATVEAGKYTKDLAICVQGTTRVGVGTLVSG